LQNHQHIGELKSWSGLSHCRCCI